MEAKLDRIKNEITKALINEEILVTAVSYVNEGRYYFLRVELDKVNGLDLDAIVGATNIINPLIDKLNLLDESYILDVVSKEKGDE